MALREDLENQGSWLFRWRSYLPVIVIGIFFLALQDYEYPAGSELFARIWGVICLLVSFFGLVIRILVIGHTPKGTSGRNTKKQIAETLNKTGVYSVVRNPLYLGNFFMGLGIALFPYLWWLAVIYVLVFWIYYERIILAEEAFLREKFGEEFFVWAKKTPAFIPRFREYQKADLEFSVKNVMRREYNGFLAVIVVLFLLDTIGRFYVEGKFELSSGWLIMLAVGIFVWTVLRTLKKNTTVLDVEGR